MRIVAFACLLVVHAETIPSTPIPPSFTSLSWWLGIDAATDVAMLEEEAMLEEGDGLEELPIVNVAVLSAVPGTGHCFANGVFGALSSAPPLPLFYESARSQRHCMTHGAGNGMATVSNTTCVYLHPVLRNAALKQNGFARRIGNIADGGMDWGNQSISVVHAPHVVVFIDEMEDGVRQWRDSALKRTFANATVLHLTASPGVCSFTGGSDSAPAHFVSAVQHIFRPRNEALRPPYDTVFESPSQAAEYRQQVGELRRLEILLPKAKSVYTKHNEERSEEGRVKALWMLSVGVGTLVACIALRLTAGYLRHEAAVLSPRLLLINTLIAVGVYSYLRTHLLHIFPSLAELESGIDGISYYTSEGSSPSEICLSDYSIASEEPPPGWGLGQQKVYVSGREVAPLRSGINMVLDMLEDLFGFEDEDEEDEGGPILDDNELSELQRLPTSYRDSLLDASGFVRTATKAIPTTLPSSYGTALQDNSVPIPGFLEFQEPPGLSLEDVVRVQDTVQRELLERQGGSNSNAEQALRRQRATPLPEGWEPPPSYQVQGMCEDVPADTASSLLEEEGDGEEEEEEESLGEEIQTPMSAHRRYLAVLGGRVGAMRGALGGWLAGGTTPLERYLTWKTRFVAFGRAAAKTPYWVVRVVLWVLWMVLTRVVFNVVVRFVLRKVFIDVLRVNVLASAVVSFIVRRFWGSSIVRFCVWLASAQFHKILTGAEEDDDGSELVPIRTRRTHDKPWEGSSWRCCSCSDATSTHCVQLRRRHEHVGDWVQECTKIPGTIRYDCEHFLKPLRRPLVPGPHWSCCSGMERGVERCPLAVHLHTPRQRFLKDVYTYLVGVLQRSGVPHAAYYVKRAFYLAGAVPHKTRTVCSAVLDFVATHAAIAVEYTVRMLDRALRTVIGTVHNALRRVQQSASRGATLSYRGCVNLCLFTLRFLSRCILYLVSERFIRSVADRIGTTLRAFWEKFKHLPVDFREFVVGTLLSPPDPFSTLEYKQARQQQQRDEMRERRESMSMSLASNADTSYSGDDDLVLSDKVPSMGTSPPVPELFAPWEPSSGMHDGFSGGVHDILREHHSGRQRQHTEAQQHAQLLDDVEKTLHHSESPPPPPPPPAPTLPVTISTQTSRKLLPSGVSHRIQSASPTQQMSPNLRSRLTKTKHVRKGVVQQEDQRSQSPARRIASWVGRQLWPFDKEEGGGGGGGGGAVHVPPSETESGDTEDRSPYNMYHAGSRLSGVGGVGSTDDVPPIPPIVRQQQLRRKPRERFGSFSLQGGEGGAGGSMRPADGGRRE